MKLDEFLDDQKYFTSSGELSGHGKVKYWRSVDKLIEGFDKYEISM